jgi:hypothetical protein
MRTVAGVSASADVAVVGVESFGVFIFGSLREPRGMVKRRR